jgi:hypothetical protein
MSESSGAVFNARRLACFPNFETEYYDSVESAISCDGIIYT